MRKFVVSDLHGCGEVYDSIMGYLENIALVDDVELTINGDLIDCGLDSFRMFEDVIKRLDGKGNVKVRYLGGNHELMMYQALLKKSPNQPVSVWSDWMENGGWTLEGELDGDLNPEEKSQAFLSFLGTLNIYHPFLEKIQGKPVLVVHAQAPKVVKAVCDLKISDNDSQVFKAVWTRANEYANLFGFERFLVEENKLGKEGYCTIIGHTPVKDNRGFTYHKKENYFNIDGGCAAYALGHFEYNHVPLVEICEESLKFFIFNHNNEILDGYVFDGVLFKMPNKELGQARLFLNPQYNSCEENEKKRILEILE